MSFLKLTKLRPGVSGYSAEPIDPNEALLVENMEVDRDGTWNPRPGLTRRVGFSSTIIHLSTLAADNTAAAMAVVEGGNLRRVTDAGVNSLLLTGWPTSGVVKNTIGGNSANTLYWIACKAKVGGAKGVPYSVTKTGVATSLGGSPPSGNWVENYGVFTMLLDGEKY